MKSKKVRLEELRVKSFVVEHVDHIVGGLAGGRTYLPELCPTEDGIVCSGVLVCEEKEKRQEERHRAI